MTGPTSLDVGGFGGAATGRAAGCGPRAGMGPGCDLRGRTVRGGTVPRSEACDIGVWDEVVGGAAKSSESPSTKANWRLSVRRARSRPWSGQYCCQLFE